MSRASLTFLLVFGVAICAALATRRCLQVDSDAFGTLLVSQSILHEGSVALDHYGDAELARYSVRIHTSHGHRYYYFPVGTSLVAVPFVAVANALGFDARTQDASMQRVLLACCALGIATILVATARLFVEDALALLLAAICWFGSAYVSTLGSALWSHDFGVLFASAAIYLVVRFVHAGRRSSMLGIGALLFFAYLCRPTFALLAPFALGTVFLRDRRAALVAGATAASLLGVFVAWSFHEYGTALPAYYLPTRLAGADVQDALVANLVSPARGLLVFQPFLVVGLGVFVVHAFRSPPTRRLAWLVLAWPIAHWLAISRFPHWWAGASFGSRLMVDAMPGLFLGVFAAAAYRSTIPRAVLALALPLAVFSVFVHAYKGSYNGFTLAWNMEPSVDAHPELVFDWRYPQFLHNRHRHLARLRAFGTATLE